jgi:hypothetical protein
MLAANLRFAAGSLSPLGLRPFPARGERETRPE